MHPPLVLASGSPSRLALLRAAGIPCTVTIPDVDESAIHADDPVELARARATAKARALPPGGSLVLAADQVAHLDGVAFGKPRDPDDHRARLRSLRGRAHTLTTAVVLRSADFESSLVEHTVLHFNAAVSDDEIDAYVATKEGSGCAGGYAVEGLGAWLVDRIDGDYFNVLGLPLLRVMVALRERGWRPTFARGKY